LDGTIDPFATGLAGNAPNLWGSYGGGNALSTAGNSRMVNTILYATPNLSGFSGSVAYGFGEVQGSSAANREIGLFAGYDNGPLSLGVAYDNLNDATASDNARMILLGGKYDFSTFSLRFGYGINKGIGSLDTRDALLGAVVPFGPHTILASYIRKTDKGSTNAGANQIALGYTYAFSKRTNLYTSYGKIHNDSGANYAVGTATDSGSGNRGFNVGLRQKF
jgi:predicted porin